MGKENKGTYEKLIDLGVEKLASILITLSGENKSIENYIKSITSTDKENNKRFKSTLNRIKKRTHFIEWDKSRDFAKELEELIGSLESGVNDSVMGIESLTEFFEADSKILELCDDSRGNIGDVFTYDAQKLFNQYASQCSDKEWVIKQLFNLYQKDNYGVRFSLIKNLKEALPEKEIKNLADLFLKEAEKFLEKSSEKTHWLLGVKALAKQLKLPEMFKNAELAISSELTFYSLLEIGEVYLESGDANNALSYLLKISDNDLYFVNKKDKLLLSVYNKLGDKDKERDLALKIFHKDRNEENFQQLLNIIGKKEKENFIKETFSIISKENKFSATNANFMIFAGFPDNAENYILEHKEELNGDYYTMILPLAESMEKSNHYLSASVIYRALLDSILRRARSKYYPYGAKYLKKLDNLALQITDWKEITHHKDYFAEVKLNHKKKYAFWNEYS